MHSLLKEGEEKTAHFPLRNCGPSITCVKSIVYSARTTGTQLLCSCKAVGFACLRPLDNPKLIRRAAGLFRGEGTFPALADAAQVVPGIDAGGMAVLQVELDRITAHRVGAGGLGGRGVHGQHGGRRSPIDGDYRT